MIREVVGVRRTEETRKHRVPGKEKLLLTLFLLLLLVEGFAAQPLRAGVADHFCGGLGANHAELLLGFCHGYSPERNVVILVLLCIRVQRNPIWSSMSGGTREAQRGPEVATDFRQERAGQTGAILFLMLLRA